MCIRDRYHLSTLFYDIMNHNKKTFKLPKNKSAVVNKIGKLIMDNRELKGYGDVDDDDIRSLVKEATGTDESIPTVIYLYEQSYLFTKMYHLWCPLGVEREEVTINDKLRVFGIMTSALFRDEMDCLIRGKARDRAELDNPEYRQSTIFDKFAKAFNNPDIDICHPKDYHKLDGCISMNPNEKKRIEITRDGKWFKRVYDNTMKHYHLAMIRWKEGTGGGKSSGQHFVNWQLREPYEFQ